MATTTRTVAHALFDYARTRKVSRLVGGKLELVDEPYIATALRGAVIEVNDVDLERGERLGALVKGELPTPARPVPEPAQTPEVAAGSEPAVAATVEGGHLDPVDPAVAPNEPLPVRPPQAGAVGLWREYAVARGVPRAEADAMSKQDIIARFPG